METIISRFLGLSRCVRDVVFHRRETRDQLCVHCVYSDPLNSRENFVRFKEHCVVLHPEPGLARCDVCRRILSHVIPAVWCRRCVNALFNFLESRTPAELLVLTETADVDPVILCISDNREC